MERLTRTSDFGEAAFTFDLYINCRPSEWEKILNVATKLKEYEDLEEQGRLIKLPCKVGDDVYYILGIPNKTPCTIDKCTFELSDINKIGKTLFLTREEAEAKLKETEDANVHECD